MDPPADAHSRSSGSDQRSGPVGGPDQPPPTPSRGRPAAEGAPRAPGPGGRTNRPATSGGPVMAAGAGTQDPGPPPAIPDEEHPRYLTFRATLRALPSRREVPVLNPVQCS